MSIQSTDDNSAGLSEDAAEAALMESLGGDPADTDSNDEDLSDDAVLDQDDDDQDLDEPEGDDQDLDDTDEDQDDDAEEEEVAEAAPLTDDAEVEVTVNGETQKVTIGSLKRLAGQEASLTRKSQEADLVGGRAAAALQAAIETVQEDLAPYQGVDWLVLQQELAPEEFAWHRQNASRAQERFQKLVGAAQGVEQTFAQRRQNLDQEAITAAVQELKTDIPDWGDKVYSDILAYGVDQGLDAADVSGITNAKVIKLLRKAMLYDRGQKVATKKVKQAAPKPIRGDVRQDDASKASKVQKATRRLAQTGSEDDAVAVLLGRWG